MSKRMKEELAKLHDRLIRVEQRDTDARLDRHAAAFDELLKTAEAHGRNLESRYHDILSANTSALEALAHRIGHLENKTTTHCMSFHGCNDGKFCIDQPFRH